MATVEPPTWRNSVDSIGTLQDLRTPALLIDVAAIERSYERFCEAMPEGTVVRYATKCNPNRVVLQTLFRLGCSFEAASAGELELLASIGVEPNDVIHTFPHRSRDDLAGSAELGVGLWVVDSAAEVDKLARSVPGAAISVRIAVDDSASRWHLSRKFGADESTAADLVRRARRKGLDPTALTFHVGSQETDVEAWGRAIAAAGRVLDAIEGPQPEVLNIGGGFPIAYAEQVPQIEEIGNSIARTLDQLGHKVRLEAEPGRYLVAEAGTVLTEVTGVTVRDDRQWVFVDVGAFGGLFEASPGGGQLTYQVQAEAADTRSVVPSVLAGPTCDGDDTIGDAIPLPADLRTGERLRIPNAGAYSSAYSTGFCGLSPVEVSVTDTRTDEPALRVGGVDIYRVAWPGSELFERALLLEEKWFELSGFVEADGLSGYKPYEAASTFVVVQSPDGDVLSVCRLISASAVGFKTTNDFELSPEGEAMVSAVPESQIIEVGTMATHPAARGLGPTLDVMRGVLDVAKRRRVTHLLTSLDAGLFEVFTAEPFLMPCRQIGEAKEYFGSPTIPGFGPIAEHETLLRERSPELYEYFYGVGQVRPIARRGY